MSNAHAGNHEVKPKASIHVNIGICMQLHLPVDGRDLKEDGPLQPVVGRPQQEDGLALPAVHPVDGLVLHCNAKQNPLN